MRGSDLVFYRRKLLLMSLEEYEKVKDVAINRRSFYGSPGVGEVVCPIRSEVVQVDEVDGGCSGCPLKSDCFVHK